jgi:hypothetical protein
VFAAGLAVSVLGLAPIASSGALGTMIRQTAVELVPNQLATHHVAIPGPFATYPADDPLFQYDYLLPAFFDWWVHGATPFGVRIDAPIRNATIRLFYCGGIATALAAFAIALLGRGRVRFAVWACSTHAALFSLGLFPSAIWLHLAYVLPPLLLVLAWLGQSALAWCRRRSTQTAFAARAVLAALAVAGTLPALRFPVDLRAWNDTPLELPGVSVHLAANRAQPLRDANAFLVDCAAPGDPVFVMPAVPLLYVTSGRRNPTAYDLTIPGNVREDEIVNDLERAGVDCIVRDPRMPLEYPDFVSLFPGLERYLRERFELLPAPLDDGPAPRHAFERWVRRPVDPPRDIHPGVDDAETPEAVPDL